MSYYTDPRAFKELEKVKDHLQEQVREASKRITALEADVERYKRPGTFYLRMQTLIKNDPNIAAAWSEFYTFMCLAAPNIEEINKEI